MSTHHKDACPCGSGKRYKHCHLAADQARARRGWGAAIAAVILLVVGAGAWGAMRQWQAGRDLERGRLGVGGDTLGGARPGAPGGAGDVAGATSPAPQGAFGGVVPGRNNLPPLPATTARPLVSPGGGSSGVLPGENPVAWQYDVAQNRHYDPRPGHQHWHSGPPPGDTTGAVPTGGSSSPVVRVGSGSGATTVTPNVVTRPVQPSSQPLAPGENPAPWEFDAAKNRHFDPRDGHRHWHTGPPPAPDQRSN